MRSTEGQPRYVYDLEVPWRKLESLGYERTSGRGPVSLGLELLDLSFSQFRRHQPSHEIRDVLVAACSAFLTGVNNPWPLEFPTSGIDCGCHVSMQWLGIVSSLIVPISEIVRSEDFESRPKILRGTSDPMCLEIAADFFSEQGDYDQAGRCMEELAEIFAMNLGNRSAEPYLKMADEYFDIRRSRAQKTFQDQRRRYGIFQPLISLWGNGSDSGNTIIGSPEFQAFHKFLNS